MGGACLQVDGDYFQMVCQCVHLGSQIDFVLGTTKCQYFSLSLFSFSVGRSFRLRRGVDGLMTVQLWLRMVALYINIGCIAINVISFAVPCLTPACLSAWYSWAWRLFEEPALWVYHLCSYKGTSRVHILCLVLYCSHLEILNFWQVSHICILQWAPPIT